METVSIDADDVHINTLDGGVSDAAAPGSIMGAQFMKDYLKSDGMKSLISAVGPDMTQNAIDGQSMTAGEVKTYNKNLNTVVDREFDPATGKVITPTVKNNNVNTTAPVVDNTAVVEELKKLTTAVNKQTKTLVTATEDNAQ